MKKISIFGWYGTETIGDRAILAGIISLLSKVYGDLEIYVGSLYPEYSERMLYEDADYYSKISNVKIRVSLFDSKDKKEVMKYIRKSDIVAMGGGPIMHINPLKLIDFTFNYAKKYSIKTALLGCGVGPLFSYKFKIMALRIINNSDIVILRDNKSKENVIAISKELNKPIDESKIKVSFDPAVECALQYKKKSSINSNNFIVVNIRDFPEEYSRENIKEHINNNLKIFIADLSKRYLHKNILLVPMHYYFTGNDDRIFLNRILYENKELSNVFVQNEIITLEETMDLFINSSFCIGMRFHSVVLQTILSRRNYILDYTEPNKGKISGFIRDVDNCDFYFNRYVNLQENVNHKINIELLIKNEDSAFNIDLDYLESKLKSYVRELINLF